MTINIEIEDLDKKHIEQEINKMIDKSFNECYNDASKIIDTGDASKFKIKSYIDGDNKFIMMYSLKEISIRNFYKKLIEKLNIELNFWLSQEEIK